MAWEEEMVRFMRPPGHQLTEGNSELIAPVVVVFNDCLRHLVLEINRLLIPVIASDTAGLSLRTDRRAAFAKPRAGGPGSVGLLRGAAGAR